MKKTFTCHFYAALCALIFSGCGMTSDSNAVKDPTVEQMADLEKQWGMKPRETRPRYSPNAEPSTYAPSGAPTTAPSPPAPALNPVPFPPTPTVPSQTIPLPPSEAPSIPSSLR